MKVLVAGASGVIGRRIVRLLVADGHEVLGITRSVTRSPIIKAAGAEPIVCDVFDAPALDATLRSAAADVVVHQLTDLPDERSQVSRYANANARIRREGTRNLLHAAKAAGAGRVLAQSVAWGLEGDAADAVRDLEESVARYPGVVLRYGQFYGAETYWQEAFPPPPRVHIDRAAEATIAALLAEPQILTVIDR